LPEKVTLSGDHASTGMDRFSYIKFRDEVTFCEERHFF